MAYILNGQLHSETNIQLNVEKNGSFWYGDGFFEAMKYVNGQLMFAEEHWDRITQSCHILKMRNPFSNKNELVGYIHQLAAQYPCKVLRVKLSMWRNTWQAYQPEDDQIQYVLVATEHEHAGYPLNEEGLSMGIFTDHLKSISCLGNIKSNSSQLYVLATLYTQSRRLNDTILLNTRNNPIESSRSNLFIIKNDTLYTPPLNEGCLDGIMRRIIINLCSENQLPLQQEPVTMDMLVNADAVFTSSSIRGIQWVKEVNHQPYSPHPVVQTLVNLLNIKAMKQ